MDFNVENVESESSNLDGDNTESAIHGPSWAGLSLKSNDREVFDKLIIRDATKDEKL